MNHQEAFYDAPKAFAIPKPARLCRKTRVDNVVYQNKARQLLQEAGYPNGFEAGECSTDTAFASVVEAAANDLGAVGIRLKVRPMERAAIQAAQSEKKVKN